MLCPPRWVCLRSCLPACLPSGLGCCVRLAGLVFLLSAVLSPVLSAGMPCPPRWAVSGLVSQLVSHLVWDALSASLVLSFSCLWSCLAAFVFVLSRSLSFIWDAVSAPPGLVFFLSLVLSPKLVSHLVWDAASASLALSFSVSASLVLSFSCLRSCRRSCLPSWLGCRVRLAGLSPVLSPSLSPIWSGLSPVLSPSLSPIWSGMFCPPPWSCFSFVSGFVSQLWSLFCIVACLSCGMLCLPPPPVLAFFLSLVLSPLVWDAVFAFLARLPAQLVSGFLSHPVFPAGLVCPCSGQLFGGLRWCNLKRNIYRINIISI